MGNPLFGVDIAGLIKQHVAPGLLDVTVTRMIDGGREAGNLTGGKAKTPQAFTGIKGIWEDLPSTPPAGVTFELNDRIALLIGDTIPEGGVPLRNDAIEIEGLTLYAVQLLKRDPAAATYRFLCRDRRGPDKV